MFKGDTLQLAQLEEEYVELCFDNKLESVNKFDNRTAEELAQALDVLDAQKDIKGLLISSNKPVFIVGADITEFTEVFKLPREQFAEFIGKQNRNFNRLEDLPYPTVVAINGFALGGGFELCLACDYRVIAENAAIGFPETSLGIFPGWGGTVRLPRLIGFESAALWITSGAQQRPEAALKAGAIDKVSPADELRTTALALLTEAAEGADYKKRRTQKMTALPLDESQVATMSNAIREQIVAKSGDHYPALLKVVDVQAQSALLDRDAALQIESDGFYEICQTAQARAMVGVFLNDQYLMKIAKSKTRLLKEKGGKVNRAAVIGAGIMGGGIAYQNALKGYPVLMKDIADPALDLGMSEASQLLAKRVDRGKMAPLKALNTLSKIRPTLSNNGLEECDAIIEAVVELESVKKTVLADIETHVPESTVMASNTSTISITSLAEALKRPENFCGMHFFNPVHAMPLVEVIRGEKTSDETIASIVDYALGLGKKPVVVNDCPGFLVNRVLFAYTFGFEALLAEGADFLRIDETMEKWGWPMGPAYLMDVVGIDTVAHCYDVMVAGLPQRFIPVGESSPTELIYKADRFGQKNGLGYYKYELNEKGRSAKVVDTSAINILAEKFGQAKQYEENEIVERMMLAMATEMVQCLDEGVVASPQEADMALVYGVGFPVFRGGLFRWMDEIGMQKICEWGDKYKHISPLYEPTESMRDMAANGKSWY